MTTMLSAPCRHPVGTLSTSWQPLDSPEPHRASCSPVLAACVRAQCIALPQGVDRVWISGVWQARTAVLVDLCEAVCRKT